MEKFTSANFVVKETGVVGILDDETCILICRSEFLGFRGSCASIFDIFFLNSSEFHTDFLCTRTSRNEVSRAYGTYDGAYSACV